MGMAVTQVRLPDGLSKALDSLVDKGFYSNRSDVVRDAVRKLVLEKQVGSVSGKGNSVAEIRALRKKLSKQKLSLVEINSLGR